jgi:hypothetical protein
LNELTELVSSLQKKVALLEQHKSQAGEWEDCHESTNDEPNGGEVEDPSQVPSGASPIFAGPTSSSYSLGVAKMILEKDHGASKTSSFNQDVAGAASFWEEEEDSQEEAHREAIPSNPLPLHGLHLRDALRLLQVYHECVGVLHPIIDLEILVHRSRALWQPTALAHQEPPQTPTMETDDHLYLALAVALLAEGGGSNTIAADIYSGLQPAIAKQMLARRFTLKGQVLLLLAVCSFRPHTGSIC